MTVSDSIDEWRANVDRHMAAGTCWICQKHVVPGSGIHGLTGAHWECDVAMKEEFLGPAERGLALRRANGGWYVHIVDLESGKALCGHKPVDKARHMVTRGRWVPAKGIRATCKGCITANGSERLTTREPA